MPLTVKFNSNKTRRHNNRQLKKVRIRRKRLLSKCIQQKIRSKVASCLAYYNSLEQKGSQEEMLTHKEHLLCLALDVFAQEKQLILQSKLSARVELFYSHNVYKMPEEYTTHAKSIPFLSAKAPRTKQENKISSIREEWHKQNRH